MIHRFIDSLTLRDSGFQPDSSGCPRERHLATRFHRVDTGRENLTGRFNVLVEWAASAKR
ncbi:MAG: hypothetical protein MSG64_00030 [Pyrinomonadaceae bacterium MAG19_C2-C3]|nr:hypothetical protein [Pyrinomonadaceae bacterium MAG19_C2-C3]